MRPRTCIIMTLCKIGKIKKMIMFNNSTLIVEHFPEKEKAHFYCSTNIEKSPGLRVMFQVKIAAVSFQHINGSHWQFVVTVYSWLRNLTPESVSHFCSKKAFDKKKKRIASSWSWTELSLHLTQALNKSQIHWPLKVDIAKLCFFNNINFTPQLCHTCWYWMMVKDKNKCIETNKIPKVLHAGENIILKHLTIILHLLQSTAKHIKLIQYWIMAYSQAVMTVTEKVRFIKQPQLPSK